MTQLEQLRILNDSTLIYLDRKNQNNKKNSLIKNILVDDACFFKMEKDDAYVVLKELGILENELDNVYNELVSKKEYYRLLQYNKIDENDETILIKYPTFNEKEAFEKLSNNNSEKEFDNEANKDLIVDAGINSFFSRIKNFIKKLFKK